MSFFFSTKMEEIRHVSKNDRWFHDDRMKWNLIIFKRISRRMVILNIYTLFRDKHCARDNPERITLVMFCKVNVIVRYSTSNTTLNLQFYRKRSDTWTNLKKKKKISSKKHKNKYHESETGAKKNFRSKVDRKHQPVCFPYIVQFVKRNLSSSYSWL